MIYFLQPVDGGPIKIGYTTNPKQRRWSLQVLYKRRLKTLRAIDGGKDEEKAIHERFAHLRFGRTEQFQPAPELVEFLGLPPDTDTSPVTPMKPSGELVWVDGKSVELINKIRTRIAHPGVTVPRIEVMRFAIREKYKSLGLGKTTQGQ